jgi:hypothetical protein
MNNLAGYRCALALGLLTGLGSQQTVSPRERLIDLTVAPTISSGAVPEARQLTPQVPAVGSSRSDETKRIRVLAPQLDRADYRLGESFFFDVLVENTGSEAIEFPTLLDPASVDRQMAGATVAAITLSFKDEILGLQAVSPQLLYGAREVPGSLIALPPHGVVRIRAQGQWLLIGATSPSRPDQWPRSLQIQALVSIGGNGITPALETSQEAAPVVLRKPNR